MRLFVSAVCAALYRVPVLALYAWSWGLLIPPAERPGLGTLLRLRWIGEAVNSLLPVAQVGGDLSRARLLAARGVAAPVAGAALIADLAIGTFTQALFGIAGLAALLAVGATAGLARSLALGSLAALAAGAALFVLLRLGTRRVVITLGRVPIPAALRRRARRLAGGAADLDAAMRALARRPAALAAAAAWHLAGWLAHAGETWLVLALADARVSWTAALAIESLSSVARAAVFFVPGGLGVQEGAVFYLCRLLGVPLDAAVTLMLAKRLRELVVGVPGLVAWGAAERAPLGRLVARLRAKRSGRYTTDA